MGTTSLTDNDIFVRLPNSVRSIWGRVQSDNSRHLPTAIKRAILSDMTESNRSYPAATERVSLEREIQTLAEILLNVYARERKKPSHTGQGPAVDTIHEASSMNQERSNQTSKTG